MVFSELFPPSCVPVFGPQLFRADSVRLVDLQTTTFGGRTWKFSATARAPYLKSFNTSLPWIFLSVGLLCVALVLFLMYLLVRIDKAESIKVAALAASQAHHWLLNYVVRWLLVFLLFLNPGAWLRRALGFQCHEVRNPLHGANESISRIRDLLCGTPGIHAPLLFVAFAAVVAMTMTWCCLFEQAVTRLLAIGHSLSSHPHPPTPSRHSPPHSCTCRCTIAFVCLKHGFMALCTPDRMETKPSHTSKRSSDGTVSQNPLISSASLTLVIPKPVHNTPRDVDASVTCQLLEEKDQLTQFLRHIERAVDDAVLCQRLTVGSDTVPVKPGPCNVREEVCAVVTKALPMMAR